MLDWLYAVGAWVPYVIASLLVILACAVGRRMGVRQRRRGHGDMTELDTLEAGALGLLALMVSFSFSMTLSRYDARYSGVVDEANAIGTAALRAEMMPEPHASQLRALFREYVDIRLDIARLVREDELDRRIRRSNELQHEMWQRALALTAADPRSIPVGLFVRSLNETIDQQDTRLSALRNRVPTPAMLLLLGIALVVMGFSGYVSGLNGKRGRFPVPIIGVMVAVIIAMIGDFDRPQSGFIRVSQQAMEDLARSLR